MEAVPRLPMVSFDLKVSPDRPSTDFTKLKQYIRDFYKEDPETYSTEIRNIESLRAQAVHPVKDVNGCSILKKYYCQLHFLESRFPMSKDGPASVAFTWKDIYSGMISSGMDIKYEMVAILYNIGALHCQMGATDDRTSPEGLKMACSHFQCAAWAFQHIKDSFAQPPGMDLSPDLMQFMYQLCLAQAQECILEKSMTDNRKAIINARVATQIVDYYNLAQNALVQGGNEDSTLVDIVGSKVMKSWKRYVRFKSTYYTCVSLLYQGMQSEEQQKMGERVAYFQAALDKLNEAIKASKGLDQADAISESLMFTRDVVECKRKAAKSENEFIYHEEVVEVDSLPTIKGASLVKGISFNINDPDISGPDIFARLVPMKAHEASSLYSEEKAKLLRKINGLIDAKDEEVVSFMSCLQLDHLKAHLEPDTLPQEVVDRCAALSVKPDAIPNLIAAMDKLNDAYHDVDAMLQEIMELIKVEEKSEREYQDIMGSRAPSIVATDLTREANKYMEAHKKAADSNETLNRAMSQHVENLRVLQQSLSELQAQLPTLAPLNLENNESLEEVTMLVGKVDEMRKQRAMLASQLRESICSDDITTILVTRSADNLESLFEEELKKHDRYVKLIEQNLAAQENILKALTDAYARYAPTRKTTSEIIKQRELMLSALVSSYDAYEDLIAKSSKGMEFYRKLETNLTKLLQRVKGTCKVQQEEREAILAKNNIKIGQDSVAPQEVMSTGPKLKDYLQKRKEAQAFGSGYPKGYSVDQGQNWMSGVRMAPAGSEGTQPSVSSAKHREFTQVNTYPGSNVYQQPYAGYTPYGQNAQVPYQPPLNSLQYPSISDPSLPADAAPTAPYRPDSRASTSSDHSSSQHQLSAQAPSLPASSLTPSPDPRVSPIQTSDDQGSTLSQQGLAVKNEQLYTPASQNFTQNPYASYTQGAYPYQGYTYPANYNAYGTPTSNFNLPTVSNAYPQEPSLATGNVNTPLQARSGSSQMNVSYNTQPSNVSIIQVNSSSVPHQPKFQHGGNVTPINNLEAKTYSGVPSVVAVNTPSMNIASSNLDSSKTVPTSGSYDPSHAKAMSVPSASYNGPYGSNTITSPYANYYTSQVYNGNVSSISTEKVSNTPTVSSPSASQSSSSVYAPPNNAEANYIPVKNNQVPTTTYTVPASQQFNASSQNTKSNFPPPNQQTYAVPSLVSPTQTTFNIIGTDQTSGQNPYASGIPQTNINQTSVSETGDQSYSSAKGSVSAQYPYGQAHTSYPASYSNYYYNRGQTMPGYSAQPGQTQYPNYSASYGQQNLQSSYASGPANVGMQYNPVAQPCPSYPNPSSYLANQQVVATTTATVNQAVVHHIQNQVPTPQQQAQPIATSHQVQLNYHQGVNYNLAASMQAYQAVPQQHSQPGSYTQAAQLSNYNVQDTGQTGIAFGQQTYNSGQPMLGAYTNYASANQSSVNMNSGYAATSPGPINASTHPPQAAVTQTSEKSNIDLLAGLDFTVSDAPLQPLPQPTSVSQISDSFASLNTDSKSSSDLPLSTINGESKPQVQ